MNGFIYEGAATMFVSITDPDHPVGQLDIEIAKAIVAAFLADNELYVRCEFDREPSAIMHANFCPRCAGCGGVGLVMAGGSDG